MILSAEPDLKVFTFSIVNQKELHFQKVTVPGSFPQYSKEMASEMASQIISNSQVNKRVAKLGLQSRYSPRHWQLIRRGYSAEFLCAKLSPTTEADESQEQSPVPSCNVPVALNSSEPSCGLGVFVIS